MKFQHIAVALFLFFLGSCQSKDGDYTFFSAEEDVALGKQISAQIASNPDQFPVLDRSQHIELYRQLEEIRDQLLSSGELLYRNEFAWEMKVIDNDSIYNAFCTPGGFIYIYTGLIHFVESKDELAGIIAHEIAHGDQRHSTDQMTKTYGLRVIASILAGSDAELLANLGVNLLGLKFSRSDEQEADEFAVRYLNDTDYNPKAFAAFFMRMEERGESMGPLQFLSTHPNPANRIEKIEKIWEETGSKTGRDHTAEFIRLKKSLPR